MRLSLHVTFLWLNKAGILLLIFKVVVSWMGEQSINKDSLFYRNTSKAIKMLNIFKGFFFFLSYIRFRILNSQVSMDCPRASVHIHMPVFWSKWLLKVTFLEVALSRRKKSKKKKKECCTFWPNATTPIAETLWDDWFHSIQLEGKYHNIQTVELKVLIHLRAEVLMDGILRPWIYTLGYEQTSGKEQNHYKVAGSLAFSHFYLLVI